MKKSSRYSEKVKAGICPTHYNYDSRSFQQGAWKNLDRGEYLRNERALANRNRDNGE